MKEVLVAEDVVEAVNKQCEKIEGGGLEEGMEEDRTNKQKKR